MIRNALLTLTLSLMIAGAAFAQEEDSVSFEVERNTILLETTVNGEGPFRFAFNTGAAVTALNPETAKKLDLGERPQLTIKVGKSAVKDLRCAVRKTPHDGVIGYNFISRFVTTINCRTKVISFTRLATGKPYVGFTYATIGDDYANEIGVEGGVVIKFVKEGGPAGKAGLQKGDVIQEIDGKRAETATDYRRLVQEFRVGQKVEFVVIRNKKDVVVTVTVGAKE